MHEYNAKNIFGYPGGYSSRVFIYKFCEILDRVSKKQIICFNMFKSAHLFRNLLLTKFLKGKKRNLYSLFKASFAPPFHTS